MRRLARLVRATKPRLIRMVGVVGRVRRELPPGIDAAPSLLPSPGGAALARPAGRFPLPSGRGPGVREALQCGCLCYLWLQRSLRSRLIVCVMSLMAPGAHGAASRRRPCTPGLRPAKSPLRGPFDLSLQASGRAKAASLQNTALSPHPCGLPRPAGNVSAILRPSAPAVSARKVNKLTTGRTNVGRVRREPPPGTKSAPCPLSLPGGAALARAYRQSEPDALAG